MEPGDSGFALLSTTGLVGDARGGLRAIMVTSATAVVRVSGCMVAGGTKATDAPARATDIMIKELRAQGNK